MATGGSAIWLTGAPAAGKTTIAGELQRRLVRPDRAVIVADSDELRRLLTPQPTYSAAERDWFYSVLGGLAVWLTGSGIHVIIAATAHRRIYRDQARAQINAFFEVYISCSTAIRRARDPKGLYERAAHGELSGVPGIDLVYEPPLAPEITVDSEQLSPVAAAEAIIAVLRAHNAPVVRA